MAKLGILPKSWVPDFFSFTSPYSKQSIYLVGTFWAARDSFHYGLLHNIQAVDGHGYAPSILQRKKNQKKGHTFSPFIFIRCLIITGLRGGTSVCFPSRMAPLHQQVWLQTSIGKHKRRQTASPCSTKTWESGLSCVSALWACPHVCTEILTILPLTRLRPIEIILTVLGTLSLKSYLYYL